MTARIPLQATLELGLPPRPRRVLPHDPALQRRDGEGILDAVGRREDEAAAVLKAVEVAARAAPTGPVQALNAAAAAAAGVPLELDAEAFLGYTPWFTSPPPWCSGFYEVRQKSARQQTEFLRMRYDAEKREWSHPGSPLSMPVPHASFVLSHFWRGLRAPWPRYTYRVPGRRVFLKD
jgi:hypothetical protein